MAATMSDVAQAAGVSLSTVSNVLNHPEIVKQATRVRVEQAMTELNFRPNRQARMLAGGKDRGIGLVIHDAANPFFAEIVDSVDDVATAAGYGILLASSRTSTQRQNAALQLFAEHQVSGILLSPTAAGPVGLDELRARSIPVVLLDSPGQAGECSVSGNDVLGGRLAGAHLIDVGCRRIGFVGGPRRVHQHADRLHGLKNAMRAARLPLRDHLVTFDAPEDTLECGIAAAALIAEQIDRLDGVFCGNDLLAIGLIRQLQLLGIEVPRDLAVVGSDDIALTQLVSVPVTTVHQPMREMGRAAADLLLSEIRGGRHRHQQLTFDPSLIVRESSAR
ncbi:LacI family DNA-binding transcriptional regulator [Microlunatus sp. GCM10028923]|uniref:LacI family DNA-binding transcriptional regulator n=1 Tax=Microlunatus sp. GCM10028923 TaxID=3273400 RepID=UPI00360969AD